MNSDLQKLTEYVRSRPDAVWTTAEHLAAQTGIHRQLADRFLQASSRLYNTHASTSPRRLLPSEAPQRKPWFDHLFREPSAFLLVSSAILLGILLASDLFAAIGILSRSPLRFLKLLTWMGVLSLQIACIFWRGMLRYSWIGALLFGAVIALGSSISFSPLGWDWDGLFLGVLVLVLYIPLAITAAMAGGYRKVREESLELDRLSRQEMLARLLSVRDRLKSITSETPESRVDTDKWWQVLPSKSVNRFSLMAGMVSTLLIMVVARILEPSGALLTGPNIPNESNLFASIMLIPAGILGVTLQVGLGFISRNPIRAIWTWCYYVAGILAALLIPIGTLCIYHFKSTDFVNWMFLGGTVLISALTGGIGAQIEMSAKSKILSETDDPAALTAEMLALEFRLRPQSRYVCVMVIDAVQSSVMKAHADPFEAEWTFREYQLLIAKVSGDYLGEVHSIAGDGAVVGFRSANDALRAAQATQESIVIFNQGINRLSMPFKLRIGLHSGDVEGHLDQVQYTAVIDIAAHVEKLCPVGGIAMSTRVRDELVSVATYDTGKCTDGFQVFAVAQATGFQL
ncbi:MAG: hypothetical protein JST40_03255 [Armatimonadetes bacterium]|nr:hypothetical protein [Armatimonadota bacterium]